MGFIGKITGKDVTEKIDEHSEIYSEVLLGMHRDLQSQRKLIKDFRKEMSDMLNDSRTIQSEIQKRTSHVSLFLGYSTVAIVLSIISLGLAIWTRI